MDNNLNEYRNIRYQRTYRTIGKMSWWRIVLGIVLVIFVVFLSGWPSQMLAARGKFIAAEKAMISPAWMEDYKPETKAFIEAGVLYENGQYEAAAEAFEVIENIDAALSMESVSYLRLVSQYLESGELDLAHNALLKINPEFLSEEDTSVYLDAKEKLS